MKNFFIDTNILIYATLKQDPRFEASQRLLLGKENTAAKGFISVQNLAEMYPNLTGPKMSIPDTPPLARAKILSLASLPSLTVLPVTLEIQRRALELCERYGVLKQRYFDMQIVASMVIYGISILYTENVTGFQQITEIEARKPF